MQSFDEMVVEQLVIALDERGYLFRNYKLKKVNEQLKIIGTGGFSSVYEMHSLEEPNVQFALKVLGIAKYTVDTEEFHNIVKFQNRLSQETQFILKIEDSKEVFVVLDDDGRLISVKDVEDRTKIEENGLYLQFVLMKKHNEIISQDKFGNALLAHESLKSEREVLSFALEIGQALNCMHNAKVLHRDIKLENIYWDEEEKVYKLGDFGVVKHVEFENAETILYTNGYGAPEIVKRLNDSYDVTADIYSFGITLYLLLNDLKFPASNGYYPIIEVQYNSDFIFPAPHHSSVKMTRIIRKMCSFDSKDRYQTVQEVLIDLAAIGSECELEEAQHYLDTIDIETVTYHEKDKKNKNDYVNTRAERKKQQCKTNSVYQKKSAIYLFVLSVVFTFLFAGMQTDCIDIRDWKFWLLVVGTLIEGVWQTLDEFHIIFGIVVIGYIGFVTCSFGVSFPILLLAFCIASGCAVLSVASALGIALWEIVSFHGGNGLFDFVYRNDMGSIFLVIALLIVYQYFCMRENRKQTSKKREQIRVAFLECIIFVMLLTGIVLWILQTCGFLTIPVIINRLHLIRTGLIVMGILMVSKLMNN